MGDRVSVLARCSSFLIRALVFCAVAACAALAQTKEVHLEIQLGSGLVSSLQASADGRLLLSQGLQGVCIWLIPAGKELRCFDGARVSALAPDGRAMIYTD